MSDKEKEQSEGEEEKTSEESTQADDESKDEKAEASSDSEDSASSEDDEQSEDSSDSEESEDKSDEEESEDDEDEDSEDGEEDESEDEEDRGSSASLLIGVLALAAGFGIGWFGHDYQVQKAIKTADAAVQGEGEGARGPCKEWESALCTKFGEKAFACAQAKAGSSLLSGSACEQAMSSIETKIAAIEAQRAPCTNLMEKLCGELGAESQACGLVKTQTPSFPPERCEDMAKNYDKIVQQLKMMEERGAIPGAGGPGGPGGARPPGHPPMRGGPPPGVKISKPGDKPSGDAKPTPPQAPAAPPASAPPKPAAPAPAPSE